MPSKADILRGKWGCSQWRSSRPACIRVSDPCVGSCTIIICTYDSVVLTADGAGIASRATANSDNGDGRAVNSEENLEVGQHDAEQVQKDIASGRIGL